MAIRYMDERVTPTQFAKLIVGDKVSMAEEYWTDELDDAGSLTDREREQIQDAIEKQADRVYKLLRYWELREKVFGAPE